MTAENATYAYVEAFVDELARSGVKNVCICPGSRSTPLTLVLANHPQIRTWLHVDERSAAFFALGLAKATRQPAAVVCTSGTAAANFYPAVIEARYSRLPLIVLTADRPPELRDIGAPQAIDQLELYGHNVKWFVEMALPEASNSLMRYARTTAGRAAATAMAQPAGPVHINFPLREPLTPGSIAGQPLPPERERDPVAWYGRPDNRPFVSVTPAKSGTDEVIFDQLVQELAGVERGLIIAGPQDDIALARYLAQTPLPYPVLADPLSQIRGFAGNGLVIDAYDAFLRDPNFVEKYAPQVVIRVGAMPTAKPVLLYLQRYPQCRQIVFDPAGGWNEPTAQASDFVYAEPLPFFQRWFDNYSASFDDDSVRFNIQSSKWAASWLAANERTQDVIAGHFEQENELSEGKVFAELAKLMPTNSTIFAGNSMPVRDLDTFFHSTNKQIRVMSNRGANGIDGVVSTALGAAAVSNDPLVLVIGDLSFYHDMNGLMAAKRHKLNATIIVLNNDGGGIFSFLPIAGYPEKFEEFWGTPQGLDYAHVARLYGFDFCRPTNWAEFEAQVQASLTSPGLQIIEVVTERNSNVAQHRTIWPKVSQVLN